MDWQGLSRELGRRCTLRAVFFASGSKPALGGKRRAGMAENERLA